jgi:cyanophycinase
VRIRSTLLAAGCAVVLAAGCLSVRATEQGTAAARGSLVLTGGAFGPGVIDRFAKLAGGPDAAVIYIPSASSGIKLPSGFIWIPPELADATNNTPAFEQELARLFGIRKMTVVHSRERSVWDAEKTADLLARADAVWISGGNAGRLATFMLDTRSHRALEGLLARGKTVGGESAGAIIAGSFIVRGQPGKPVLIARDNTRAFALVPSVAINPHLSESKREEELVQVVDLYPDLLGVGIDEKAAIVVSSDRFEVIGEGRVAIYDNQQHEKLWYYFLTPGSLFDLKLRRQIRPGRQ